MSDETQSTNARSIPYRFVVGLLLISIWWPVAWLQPGSISGYYFFPLWLGYILSTDGFLELRTGTSPWRRDRRLFIILFVLSAPFWWIFEGLNVFLENWSYLYERDIGMLEFAIASSFAFSTVIPAVICTAELLASFRIGEQIPGLGHWRFGTRGLSIFMISGALMLIVVAIWPTYAFPLVWLGLFFLLEPINQWVRQPSLWNHARENRWGPVYNVMLGTLVTGFFWEMWNIYAMPKWTYNVPFVEVVHVFEMPILGYFGYLPFGLEVVAFTGLCLWLLNWRASNFLQLSGNDRTLAQN